MADKAIFEIVVTDKGLKINQKKVDELGASVERTTKKTKEASKATDELNYKLNQGATGVSSAARSFSKLNQAIGDGPNGLVGAYATLAANAFAVSAAFNVLRNASQVEQVMKGLEVQGARLGLTLTNTAKSIQEISRGSLSMAESMQTAAQAAAAGLSPKTMEELAQAANNASIALGRNMSDSMDRMVKGVTKLEPELLDELGVMVKLTEASQKYADQHNKVASALTNSEKRQAFLNAVLEESRVKFGGLSEEVKPEPYQQLAASFQNLTTNVLNFVNNTLGFSSFIKLLAENTTLLVSIIIMFVSTISRQLIPGLYSMSDAALKARDAINKKIAAQKMSILAAKQEAEANRSAARSNVEQLAAGNNKKYVVDYANAVKAGTATEENRTKVLKQLYGQLGGQTAALKRLDSAEKAQIATKEAIIAEINKQILAIKELTIAELNAATVSEQSARRLEALTVKQTGLRRLGAAQSAQASAIDAASTFNLINAKDSLGKAFNRVGKATALYSSGLQKTGQSYVQLMGYAGNTAKVIQTGIGISNAARVSFFALSSSVRVLGAALLNAIPIIGQIIFAIQMLWEVGKMAWDWMFPPKEGQEALDKAKEAHQEILNSVQETAKQVNKVLGNSSLSAGQHADALAAVSNKVKEIADSYDEVVQAQARLGSSRATIESNPIAGIELAAGKTLSESAKKGSSEALEAVSKLRTLGYDKLTEAIDKAITYNEAFWAATDTEKANMAAQLLPRLRQQFGRVGEVTQESVAALKEVDQAYRDFIQAATITTPFDGLVTAFQKTEMGMLRLQNEFDKGALSYREYSKTVVDSIKGTAVQSMLSEELQSQYRSLQEYESEITRIKAALENNRTTQGQLIQSDLQRVQIGRQILSMEESAARAKEILLDKTLEDLTANINKTYEYQKQSILAQGQARLLQVQLQKQQEIYATSGAGMKARLQKEEQIRVLEAQSLEAQAAILQFKIRQNEIAIQSAETEYNNLLAQQKLIQENSLLRARERAREAGWSEEQLAQLERAQTIPAVTETARGRGGRNRVTQEMVDTLTDIRTLNQQSLDIDTKINEATEARLALTQENRAATNALQSLQEQIAAIYAQNLTQQQKAARIAEAQVAYELELYNGVIDTKKVLLDEEESRIRLNTLARGQSGIQSELASINRSAAREQFNLMTEYYSTRLTLQAQLQSAIADEAAATSDARQAATDRVNGIRAELIQLDNTTASRARNIDLQRQINALEKIGFDQRQDGLKVQQDALSYLEKQLDTQRNLEESRANLVTLRNRLLRSSMGLPESEASQRADEIRAATLKYKLAKDEFEIKSALINLEFELLDAQRQLLKEQLESQKRNLLSTGAYDENSAAIQQLSTAIANLDIAAQTREMREAAQQGLREALKESKYELQITLNKTGAEQILANNPAYQMVAAIRGIVEEVQARREASTELANGVTIRGVRVAANAQNATTLAVNETGTLLLQSQTDMNNRLEAIKIATQTMANNATERVNANTPANGESQLASVIGRDLSNLQPSSIQLTPQAVGAINGAVVEGFRILTRDPGNLLAWPVENFRMGQGYGAPRDGGRRSHGGIDLITEFRAEVITPISGYISNLVRRDSSNAGLMATITDDLTGLSYKIMHLDSIVPDLRIGDRVTAGQIIGRAGLSGNAEAQPGNAVVHVEAYLNGRRFDPRSQEIPLNIMSYADTSVSSGWGDNEIIVTGTRGNRDQGPLFGGNNTIGAPSGIDYSSPEQTAEAVTNLATAMQTAQIAFGAFNAVSAITMTQLSSMGTEGEFAAQFIGGMQMMSAGIQQFAKDVETSGVTITNSLMLASAVIAGIQQMLNASSNDRIANIDKEIAAEQKRDGKSAESLAKLDAMEKKKDAIARKQFNTNKKLMLAQAVMATAAGIANALGSGLPPPANIILAGIIGAMGAAQLAIIAGTQYESSYTPKTVTTPSTMTIGKRGDSVDLAKGPNYNAGGEVGYLRGASGTGSNASNFNTIGSAYGGELMRGYGNRGFVVGEKGPEVITPETPITVTPANENNGSAPVNATINIQALDASDVQKVLVDQRGNIIQMLRDAANASGKGFMEDVNVNIYTRPNVNRL